MKFLNSEGSHEYHINSKDSHRSHKYAPQVIFLEMGEGWSW